MILALSPAGSPPPRDEWRVGAFAVSAQSDHRQPVALYRGASRELACRAYFEALVAASLLTLKNRLEQWLQSQAPLSEELLAGPFGWLGDWPVDFFDQGARTAVGPARLIYFDASGREFRVKAELSPPERELLDSLIAQSRSLLSAPPEALLALRERVELLFSLSEPPAREGGSAFGRL